TKVRSWLRSCFDRPRTQFQSSALASTIAARLFNRAPTNLRERCVHLAQYYALRVVNMTLQGWPIEVDLWIASVLGNGLFLIDKRHRKRAMSNIRKAFPEKSEAWVYNI